MTKAKITERVLFLALMAPLLSMAACSWDYTPQRSPDVLSSNPSPVQGRIVTPGEADNYQQWLAGEPNQLNALPWKNSVLKPASPAPVIITSPAPAATGWTTTTTTTSSSMSTVNTPVGPVRVQEQYPPYSR